jgi:hypothetical protein
MIDIGLNEETFRYEYLMFAILQKILVLNDELKKVTNDFLLKAKPTNQTQLYCAQIRTKDDRTPKSDVIKFWHFMSHEFISNNTNDYRIFITTNDYNLVEKTLSFIDQSKIIKPKTQLNNAIQDIHAGQLKIKGNCTLVEPSILDFYLLQYCDKIINSESGFGIFATLNRPEPFKEFYAYVLEDVIWKRTPRFHKKPLENERNYTFLKLKDFRKVQYNYF